jgi:hypothetical protein
MACNSHPSAEVAFPIPNEPTSFGRQMKKPLRGLEKCEIMDCLTTDNMLADMQSNEIWHPRPP